MHLSERAIELPRLVILASLLICVLGAAAVLTLPKERTPRVKLPVIVVATPNPGASPSTNEKQIIDKIEDEVETSLSNLRDQGAVHAQAMNGVAVMQFVFDDGITVTEAKRDVESLVNRIKGQFPPDAQQDPGPLINDIAFEDFPVIQVFVAGGDDGRHRRRVADQLKTQIEKVTGIAGVDIFGGLEREVQIELAPHLMALYGFSYQEIESAVRRANADVPTGSIESSSGSEQRVRTQGKLHSIEAIQQVPLGARQGKPIALGDVARVHMGSKPLKTMARYGGRDAVVLLARAKTDIDVLDTANTIRDLVDDFEPGGHSKEALEINTIRSQGREIQYMLRLLITSAIYGMILVVVVLWVAMGWRNASLISIAVPFTILGSAALMWVCKQTVFADLSVNNITLFGLILVVGMVVDGGIIVGENIYRHRELGRPPIDSAKRGILEVGGSLSAAYLTTFAAFAPMFMIRGVMGDYMQTLPTVVLFALCSAMLVDHFLLPVLSVYLMKVRSRRGETATADDQKEDLTLEEMEIADAEAAASASPMKRVYGRVLTQVLQHRLLVMGLSLVVAAMPVGMFVAGALTFEFFPDSDIPVIEVHFELPLGSSMENRTVAVASQIEQAVLRAVRPEEWNQSRRRGGPVRPVTTIGEPGALNIRLDDQQGIGPEFGMVYVELALAEDRQRSSAQIRRAIAEALPPLPGVLVRIISPDDGPPTGAPVLVRVMGRTGSSTSIEELAQQAKQIEDILRQTPGAYDIASDYRVRPELSVTPNRTVASLFDIDTNQIVTSVNYALEGVRIGEVDFGGTEQIDMRLRNLSAARDQLEDLANLPIRSQTGKIVSLDQVANIDRVQSANIIRHYDQQRVINVRAELEDGVLPDDAKKALVAALHPDLTDSQQNQVVRHKDILYADRGVIIEFGGENEVRDDALADLNLALIVAAGTMMIILVVKLNSFIQPFIIMFSVPLSMVGVSIGLMICGFNFSVAAMIGVVALSGIVVNDAIVLVDFINRLRQAGVPMQRAVVFAGQLRLRPILITTVTTIAGLLPLGLNLAGGGEFFQPMAVTIMFGLGFATLLQLFIIPLACYSLHFRSSYLDPMENPQMSGEQVVTGGA